jgi:hypothetical protein
MSTIDSRAAAAASGSLATFRGEERRQEFRSTVRTSRAQKDDKEFLVLDGYASTVEQGYTMYDFFGPYTEIIDRGAFDATLKNDPDVNFLINHTGLSMARTTAGTLELAADDTGLRSIAYLNPQRSDVRDLELALRDGALDQMSFAFRITDGQWSPDYTEYRITQVDLDRGDVSAVNYGANPFTSISARAKQAFDAIDHLEGEPLRIAAARAQARLAEVTPPIEPPVFVEVKRSTPNIRTLRARLELDA